MTRLTRALALAGIGMILLPVTIGSQGQLNPKAVEFIKAADIKWVATPLARKRQPHSSDTDEAGHARPAARWLPGNMSRPSLPSQRSLSSSSSRARWWLGSGEKAIPIARWVCRPEHSSCTMPAIIHYYGAKDAPVVIQVMGMGPNTSTPAEKKKSVVGS